MTAVLLSTALFINAVVYLSDTQTWARAQPFETSSLIGSGIAINSFNPTHIHFTLRRSSPSSYFLSILDDNVLLFQSPSASTMTLILSDGYHQLQLFLHHNYSSFTSSHISQQIDLCVGRRSLRVTVLDDQLQPVQNRSVRMELVNYSHISRELWTNQMGEVVFDYVPEMSQIYIETVCMETKQHAFAEVNSSQYRNLSLVMEKMSAMDYDEYDSNDRGYYAV